MPTCSGVIVARGEERNSRISALLSIAIGGYAHRQVRWESLPVPLRRASAAFGDSVVHCCMIKLLAHRVSAALSVGTGTLAPAPNVTLALILWPPRH